MSMYIIKPLNSQLVYFQFHESLTDTEKQLSSLGMRAERKHFYLPQIIFVNDMPISFHLIDLYQTENQVFIKMKICRGFGFSHDNLFFCSEIVCVFGLYSSLSVAHCHCMGSSPNSVPLYFFIAHHKHWMTVVIEKPMHVYGANQGKFQNHIW